MKESQSSRPGAVTVIGQLFFSAGIGLVLVAACSIVGFNAKTTADLAIEWSMYGPEGPVPTLQRIGLPALYVLFIKHYNLVMTLIAVVGVAVLVLGRQFLMLRTWARRGLQATCWLGAVALVVLAGYTLHIWDGAAPDMFSPIAAWLTIFFHWIFPCLIAVGLLALLAIVRLLSTDYVKNAFGSN